MSRKVSWSYSRKGYKATYLLKKWATTVPLGFDCCLFYSTRCGFYPKLYFLSRLGLRRGKRGRARQLGECDVRVVSGGDTAAGELPSSNLIHTNLFLLPMSHTREQNVSQCRLMWKKGRYVNANGEIAYTRVAHGEKNNECVNASFGSEFCVYFIQFTTRMHACLFHWYVRVPLLHEAWCTVHQVSREQVPFLNGSGVRRITPWARLIALQQGIVIS